MVRADRLDSPTQFGYHFLQVYMTNSPWAITGNCEVGDNNNAYIGGKVVVQIYLLYLYKGFRQKAS